MRAAQQSLLLAAALGSALAAGSLFVFSDFVGRAMTDTPDDQAAQLMQRINLQAPRSPLFMAMLFLPALLAIAAVVVALAGRRDPVVVVLVVAAAALLVIGVVGVTIGFNVPRNDLLAARDLTHGWSGWTAWWRSWRLGNDVRVVSAAASSVCLLVAASR